MSSGRLTALQVRVLEALAEMEPRWTLTEGGALVGFHLEHRLTRDLDLFLHGSTPARVKERLDAGGMEASSLQSAPSFHRLLVRFGNESTVVDLVADPVAVIEAPRTVEVGAREIAVDTPHEILVNKLCALVQRSELRDLEDLRQLVAAGGELGRALGEAPRKDSGFSPLILGWVLRDLPIAAAARAEGWSGERIEALESFRAHLIAELSRWTRPAER